jgi:hypothetical protein
MSKPIGIFGNNKVVFHQRIGSVRAECLIDLTSLLFLDFTPNIELVKVFLGFHNNDPDGHGFP